MILLQILATIFVCAYVVTSAREWIYRQREKVLYKNWENTERALSEMKNTCDRWRVRAQQAEAELYTLKVEKLEAIKKPKRSQKAPAA